MEDFDVVVVRTGPAGEGLAERCADGGLTVALVERELVGGECTCVKGVPTPRAEHQVEVVPAPPTSVVASP